MRLESALYASREGLTANGQAISVVGDNVANANTVGYKTSRAEFSDLMGEQENSRTATSGPSTGDGVFVSRVTQIHEPGTIEFTGRDLDVGIGGGGFFMVGDPANPSYTRAGNFRIAEDGTLVTAEGQQVLGYAGEQTDTVGPLNLLDVNLSGSPTVTATLFGNLDASSDVTIIPEAPTTFSQIAQAASFTANQNIYDTLGQSHDLTLAFFKTEAGTWTAQAYIDGGELQGGTKGVPVQLGANAALGFLPTGSMAPEVAAAALITATPTFANGAGGAPFTVNLSNFQQFAGGSIVNGVSQDGQAVGNINNYQIDKDGALYAVLDNGTQSLVGTLPLAGFTNVDGLNRQGNSLYASTPEAGDRVLGRPGEGAYGALQGGALELSGVDISNQFTNLILYQRGYQASSQTLNVSNELLQQTLALIR